MSRRVDFKSVIQCCEHILAYFDIGMVERLAYLEFLLVGTRDLATPKASGFGSWRECRSHNDFMCPE
jgi:hypothetical protein